MDEKGINEARKLIAGFLKERRKELGITQAELADKIEVKQQTIARIEEGKFFPSMAIFLKLTHYLDCYFFLEAKDSNSDSAKLMRERWGKINDN